MSDDLEPDDGTTGIEFAAMVVVGCLMGAGLAVLFAFVWQVLR